MTDARSTDALDGLGLPVVPIDPDATFAADLRARLQDALLITTTTTAPRGAAMTDTDTAATTTPVEQMPWPPSLTPYLAVSDGRRAIEWYVDVFGGQRRGDPYVMPDGAIGHAEIAIGDAVLMLADESVEEGFSPPAGDRRIASYLIHVAVDDVDGTVERAANQGAEVLRPPTDEPYGRVASIVDPFGHRWLLNQVPSSATRVAHGDIGYVTIGTPDAERAKAFFGAVLGWRFAAGNVPGGWQVEGRSPAMGMFGDPSQSGGATLCYRVAGIDEVAERVRAAGGEAAEVQRQPYGLLVECRDDQGTAFQLWQPT